MKDQAAAVWMLIASGIFNGVGQVIMRWGGRDAKVPFSMSNLGPWTMASKWWLLGLIVTWTSGLFWAILLRKVPLVLALPLFAGTAYLLTLVGAVFILGERPTPYQTLGILLIVVGAGLIISHP